MKSDVGGTGLSYHRKWGFFEFPAHLPVCCPSLVTGGCQIQRKARVAACRPDGGSTRIHLPGAYRLPGIRTTLTFDDCDVGGTPACLGRVAFRPAFPTGETWQWHSWRPRRRSFSLDTHPQPHGFRVRSCGRLAHSICNVSHVSVRSSRWFSRALRTLPGGHRFPGDCCPLVQLGARRVIDSVPPARDPLVGTLVRGRIGTCRVHRITSIGDGQRKSES